MTEPPNNLRTLFSSAETRRKCLESSCEPNSESFQETIRAATATYQECRRLVDQLALFSPNETVEDISTNDLQYLMLDYRLAELTLRNNASADRKTVLRDARTAYDRFLGLLDKYGLLSPADQTLHERYSNSPDTFSTASTSDAGARRDTKIARFREEKGLKLKLEYLQKNPTALQNDDSSLRTVHLTNVTLHVHETFSSLESIAQELQILALAPPSPASNDTSTSPDSRETVRAATDTERLDSPVSRFAPGMRSGPILSRTGRPLQPFTLLDSRATLRAGVFRPGHSLPTMTIDEYLAEERRRGGIVEGGGEASGRAPTPDEDDLEKADAETLKAREWDEFVESNPKGSGNTLNRG
ncbi:MAG: hypothetical protein M1832_000488 [Thelocarpon impressellum]|nr:MAG: hypothetical protein M1832_000488 [Thelocarpon impressellum]